MATVYSDNYSTGTYTYTRVKVDYSGTSATATLLYSRTNDYSGATYANNATFTFGGVSTTFNISLSGRQTDYPVTSVNFTIPTTGGTYSGSTSGADFFSFSGSVVIPAQSTPPTDLAVSVVEPKPEGAVLGVSISSYGDPASATGRYIEAAILTGNNYYSTRRVESANDVLSANIEVDNESSGNLTIVGNTQYYYGGYANNTVTQSEAVFGQFVTTAYPVTLSLTSVDINSATVGYSVQADGGFYTKTLEYSLDNGSTWATAATISSSSATSGSFNITGLTAGTEYTLKSRVKTTAGNTLNTDLTIQTLGGFYGSVEGNTKLAEKFYGSVNEQTKKVIKFYGSENGLSKKIF